MSRNNLIKIAYDYLYKSIISHKFKPGEVIIEQEVSNQLGISRTPIRAALNKLTSEGLIYQIPGRGSFVQNISVSEIEDICELRKALEIMALKSGYSEITEKEIKKVKKSLTLLNESSSKKEFYLSDRLLHGIIINHATNKVIINVLRNINSQLERIRQISSLTPKRLKESKKEHKKIIEKIEERDIEGAVLALQTHLDNVRENTIKVAKKLAK